MNVGRWLYDGGRALEGAMASRYFRKVTGMSKPGLVWVEGSEGTLQRLLMAQTVQFERQTVQSGGF